MRKFIGKNALRDILSIIKRDINQRVADKDEFTSDDTLRIYNSITEKDIPNLGSLVHDHDDRYYTKNELYTKEEVEQKILYHENFIKNNETATVSVFLSPTNGNDETGEINNIDKPFQTVEGSRYKWIMYKYIHFIACEDNVPFQEIAIHDKTITFKPYKNTSSSNLSYEPSVSFQFGKNSFINCNLNFIAIKINTTSVSYLSGICSLSFGEYSAAALDLTNSSLFHISNNAGTSTTWGLASCNIHIGRFNLLDTTDHTIFEKDPNYTYPDLRLLAWNPSLIDLTRVLYGFEPFQVDPNCPTHFFRKK